MNEPGKAGPDTLFGLGDLKQNRGENMTIPGLYRKFMVIFPKLY